VTGLIHIETLLRGARLRIAGEPRRIPSNVDRGAYRVVRDALATADAPASATVAIEYMPGALAVQVQHDGVGGPLPEIADLAAALGGGLTAAPSAGGFRVRAWLPTEGQPPSPAAPLAVH
jgi:signal transduction histidine kinase